MTDQGKFGTKPTEPVGKSGNPSEQLDCTSVEPLLAEAVEETLTAAVAEQVRAHTAECASCREKLAQERSGREWLLLLKREPLEPPSGIVARVLAKTSFAPDFASHTVVHDDSSVGQDAVQHAIQHGRDRRESEGAGAGSISDGGETPANSYLPAWQHNSVVVLRRTLFEPRLALVAAMAFFSISLTLNLMGVRLTKLSAADLEPQAMRQAFSRQYVEANARVVRYYENLRIVYEVESQVHQLRQAAETNSQPGQTSNKKSEKRAPGSSRDSSYNETDSHRVGMASTPEVRGHQHAIPPDPKPMVTGPLFNAAFDPRFQFQCAPQVFSCAPHAIYFSTRERRLA